MAMRRVNRKTKQRDALVEIFARAKRPLSVDELHEAAGKKIASLGIATVYRALAALIDAREIVPVEIPGEPTRYERSGKAHHHHFQCERCERVFDLAGCFENLLKLAPPRFTVRSHALALYGLCPSCAT
jgi:Fur family ferric uptake transcriptional regulator